MSEILYRNQTEMCFKHMNSGVYYAILNNYHTHVHIKNGAKEEVIDFSVYKFCEYGKIPSWETVSWELIGKFFELVNAAITGKLLMDQLKERERRKCNHDC
jgi:hypothetical protein